MSGSSSSPSWRAPPAFYVGATMDPLRRWVGDADGGEQRGPMPGHRDARWNEFRVAHVAHRRAPPSLDAGLFRDALETHPAQRQHALPAAARPPQPALNLQHLAR